MGIENVGLEKPTLSIAIGNAYMSKNVSVSVSIKILSCHTVIKSQDQHLVQLIKFSAQRVPEPDPLPGISFDTRPDPIQF